MSTFFFLFRELLGTIRARSGLYLSLAGLFLLLSLGSFAALLLVGGTSEGGTPAPALGETDIVLGLSPRLSADAVNELYVEFRERPDVAAIHFLFAGEVNPGETGGRFHLEADSVESVGEIVALAGTMSGVTGIEVGEPTPEVPPPGLTPVMRIVLLVALVASIGLALLMGRLGYRALLTSFHGEIRVMRLAGTSEQMVAAPVIGLGVLMGLLTGLLLIVGIFLAQYALGQVAEASASWIEAGRIVGVSVAGLFLGLFLGGLIGVLGAGLLNAREYAPLAR